MTNHSTLLDIFDAAFFDKWQAEIKEKEGNPYDDVVDNMTKELSENMSDDEKELLRKLKVTVENQTTDFYYKLYKRVLNVAVKIGMELGAVFADIDSGNY